MTRTDDHSGPEEHAATPPAPSSASDSTLQELGIVAKMQTSYEWGGFRYTNALDAIAAAKRAKR